MNEFNDTEINLFNVAGATEALNAYQGRTGANLKEALEALRRYRGDTKEKRKRDLDREIRRTRKKVDTLKDKLDALESERLLLE